MDTQTEIEAQKELSRQWIDRLCSGRGLEGAWRLQLIGQRSRVLGTCDDAGWLTDAAGEYYVDLDGNRLAPASGTTVAPDGTISPGVSAVRAIDSTRPMRIRRFAKGIPSSCVDEAIRHLLAKAPYTGLVFNGTPIDGTYVPTHTWWEREDRDTVDRGKYTDNVYTLFQDLWDRDRGDADDVAPSGCTCSEETSTRYVHDAFSVESVECRGQGYSVAIQSAGRNEDGTYDYSVVTRHALTQAAGPTTLKCDEFETVRETTWRNAYGSPGAWTDQDGAPVAAVDACSAPPGTTYEVTARQNDDCTYDVTVRETVANGVDPSGLRTSATIYQKDRERSSSAEASPPDEVESASGGVVRTNEHTLRPDGKYDVKRRVQTETPVPASSTRRTKYLDGAVVETVDRNQTPAYGNAALSRSLRPGETVEVRKTDGGLRDVTVVEVDADPVGEKAADCRDTLFQHDHSDTVNQPSAPSAEHVPAAAGGVVTRVRSQLTDRGTYDVVTDTVTEHYVHEAEVRRTKYLDGVVKETTDRSSSSANVGANLKVGESVSVRRTDGGRYDVTTVEVDPESVGTKAEECSDTAFLHRHMELSNQVDDPQLVHVEPASGGVVRQRQVRVTERGTYDVTDETRREHTVMSAVVRKSKTVDGVVVETTDRSVPDPGDDPEYVGETVETSVTCWRTSRKTGTSRGSVRSPPSSTARSRRSAPGRRTPATTCTPGPWTRRSARGTSSTTTSSRRGSGGRRTRSTS